MQGPSSTWLLVGIKQEEVNPGEQWVLRPHKVEEVPNPETMHKPHKSERGHRRLYAEQDSSGSSESDCVSSGGEWKPSPAMSPSPAEVNHDKLTLKIPSTFPTGNLNAATCLSIPTKRFDTIRMQYSTVEEPTGEEPKNQLEAVRGYTCKFCGKAFAKNMLLKHVNGVHEKLLNFPCDICGASFMHSGKLKLHVNAVHENLWNFSCDICSHSFKQKADLNRHINIVHENIRNFCDICDASFQHNGDLNRHVDAVHKNLRNFPCNICGYLFKEKGALKTHVNAVHKNQRNFPCDICGYSFKHGRNLKSHVNTVHKNLRNFPCNICGNSFKERGALKAHVNAVHKSATIAAHLVCFFDLSARLSASSVFANIFL